MLDLVGVHHRVYSVVEVLGSGEPNEEVAGSLTCTQYGTESRRMQAIETICNNVAWIASPLYLLV